MANRETGKQRAARIATDFHQRSDAVQRFRLRVVGVCALVALLYLVFGMGSRAAVKYSRGPVAAVHAGWESDCSVCHQDFVPISDNAWATDWTDARAITKLKCSECHATDDHYSSCMISSKEAEVSCAFCHQEHRGYDADLSRVHNRACLQCHDDLQRVRSHSAVDGDPIAAHVTAFDADHHPAFRSLQQDPGTIRFNHQLHMSAGLVRDPEDRGSMIAKDLSVQDRKRLGLLHLSEEAAMKLECRSCHQPDDKDERSMLPVRYDSHCAACHPLSYQWDDNETLAPHGLAIPQLETHFRNLFSSEFIRKNPKMTRPFAATPLVPWKRQASSETMVAEAVRFVEDQTLAAIDTVKVRCEQCHEFEDADKLAIKSPQIPPQWFQHAEFNHRSHRFVNCNECHAQAFVDAPSRLPDHENVMIAGRDRCIQCHAQTTTGTNATARTDCVECHRYHVERIPQTVSLDNSPIMEGP